MENNLSPRTGRLLIRTLIVSIVVHLLIVAAISWQPSPPVMPMSPPIEVVDVPIEEYLKKQAAPPKVKKRPEIAESQKLDNNEIDPEAQILSEKNQKAKEQMKAKLVDDFREKQGTGLHAERTKKGYIPPTATEASKSKPVDSDMDGVIVKPSEKNGVKRDWKTLSMKDLSVLGNGLPMAATDDRLDGVREGDQTVLSTREFQYYSYYFRIKQTLRQYWKPNVERRLAVVWNRGGKLKDGEMTTQLLVLLDNTGAVAKISTVGSSGVTDIDEAAVEAFHRASPFPNPPKGIIEPDGLVRIRWDFILKAQASPSIQFRRPTGGAPNY